MNKQQIEIQHKKGLFLTDLKGELNRITWPTRDTLIKASLLVLAVVVIFTVLVGLVDYILTKAFLELRASVK